MTQSGNNPPGSSNNRRQNGKRVLIKVKEADSNNRGAIYAWVTERFRQKFALTAADPPEPATYQRDGNDVTYLPVAGGRYGNGWRFRYKDDGSYWGAQMGAATAVQVVEFAKTKLSQKCDVVISPRGRRYFIKATTGSSGSGGSGGSGGGTGN
ncbi:MAG: hypothetical protein QXM12_06125 [Nitrososphaerota archaeon]